MRKQLLPLAFLITVMVSSAALIAAQTGKSPHRISRAILADKIRGGWAGQMIGVSFGAPTEFRSRGKIIEGALPIWMPANIADSINQDDLYVEMTFAEVMDKIGLDATTAQYGEAFKNSGYALWHANAGARRLLQSGVAAPLSGHPLYNLHYDDIDFQIESDFIGLMTPGLPQSANLYCDRVGHVMNYGDGVYGGMFVTGMYSAAFFESDPRRLVEQGLASIPPDSGYAKIISDVLRWSQENPEDWRKTWALIEEKWDKDDSCPNGALQPLNIDAKFNGAYIALGLLYGAGDIEKTLEIATRAGQDSDCNPSSAIGILGVVNGFDRIDDKWKSGIKTLADKKFAYTNYSFEDISKSTFERALRVISKAGGKVAGEQIIIPFQAAKAGKLEQWKLGKADRIANVRDAAWTWTLDWTELQGQNDWLFYRGKTSSKTGATVEFDFDGTTIAIAGEHSTDGGRADVFLDNKKIGAIDAFAAATYDNDLFHASSLKPGAHKLKIIIRADRDQRSSGNKLTVYAAIPFR